MCVTVPSVKLQLLTLGSLISIFHIHLQAPYYSLVHCLSVRLGYISSSSLVSSFPAPLKRFLDIPVDRFPYSDPLRHFLKEKQPLKIPKIVWSILYEARPTDKTILVFLFCTKKNCQGNSEFSKPSRPVGHLSHFFGYVANLTEYKSRQYPHLRGFQPAPLSPCQLLLLQYI